MPDTPLAASRSDFEAPPLRTDLFLGSLQLLAWLLFRPSAWRDHISLVDSSLGEEFSILELSPSRLRNPHLVRTLLLGFAIGPLVTTLLLGPSLGVMGRPPGVILLVLVYAVAVSMTAFLAGGLVFPISVSIVASVFLGLAGGAQEAVALGLSPELSFSPPFSLPEVMTSRLVFSSAIGLAAGIVGTLIIHLPHRGATHSLTRQLGAVVVGALVAVAMLALSAGLGEAVTRTINRQSGDIGSRIMFGIVAGLVVGGVVGAAIGWRTGRGARGVIIGCIAGVVIATMRQAAASHVTSNLALNLGREFVAGIGVALFFTALFSVPYLIAARAAGTWAGAIAGTLGSSGAYVAFAALINGYPLLPIVPIALASSLMGMSLLWWQPLLAYPLESAWNLLLLRAEERRAGSQAEPSLLRLNSAFWDERQALPLLGLDDHLLLLLAREPEAGRAAMDAVATGRQRWAAQSAQIEHDARRLEACEEGEGIAEAHRLLGAGELEGPASALLRSFSRLSQDVDAALRQESAYNQRLALIAVEDRLDALLREVTRSSERYAQRFRPIAAKWRRIVAARAHRLAETAARRQEIENPYVIGVPLTEQQEVFVGRADVSATIESMLRDRAQAPLLLYGQRRMGKTSLLNNLGRLLPSTVLPLFVDLQGPVSLAKDDAELLHSLSRSMIASARRHRSLSLPPVPREALAEGPFAAFDEWLDELEKRMGEAGHSLALISMDEFEALASALEEGRLSANALLGMLRHMIQHRTSFRFMIAASHTLDEFERWASFLVNVRTVHLSFLSEAEARQLIERPVRDFALRYEPQASQRVLQLTSGHPFLVQLVCATIVDLKNQQAPASRRMAQTADVEAAIPHSLERGSFFFADIQRNQVDAAGLAILRDMAAHPAGSAISRDRLASGLAELPGLESALTGLVRRELIEAVEDGYRFRAELVQQWFARTGTTRGPMWRPRRA